jgi:hypothetical protein
MTWPWNTHLPFISVPSVWKVYNVSNPGQNETRTLAAIVAYKAESSTHGDLTKDVYEYIATPSGVSNVLFGGGSACSDWDRVTAIGDNPNLIGSGSLHSYSVSHFGSGYKRFKATITRQLVTNFAPARYPGGPQLDPGMWHIRVRDSGAQFIGGITSYAYSGTNPPTSSGGLSGKEFLAIPTDTGATPAYPAVHSSIRITRFSSTVDDVTEQNDWTSWVAELHGTPAVELLLLDPVDITSSWA